MSHEKASNFPSFSKNIFARVFTTDRIACFGNGETMLGWASIVFYTCALLALYLLLGKRPEGWVLSWALGAEAQLVSASTGYW
jgi:hypothetical protein